MSHPRARAMLIAKDVRAMSLTRKDLAATGLTLLVVLVFMATHEGWGVPMIGGIATCGKARRPAGARRRCSRCSALSRLDSRFSRSQRAR